MSFALASLAGLGLTTSLAAAVRGLRIARFMALALGVHVAVSVAVYPMVGPLMPVFWGLQAATLLHVASLLYPGLRPLPWRMLVDWPASVYVAGTFLALPWAVLRIGPWEPWGAWIPYAIAALGLVQSLTARREQVSLTLGSQPPQRDTVQRHSAEQTPPPAARPPVRIVQITDPHLGTFMSIERLAGICWRAVEAEPDIIALTGDYLTIATNHDAAALAAALAPLRAHPHVYACPGNHDHEAPQVVQQALAASGVRLLMDESVVVPTAAGPVEVVGVNHRWRDSAAHLQAVLGGPRDRGLPRLVLLHDPLRFKQCPAGSTDLALSGHTHGGQVGLVSLGADWTVVSGLMGMPDHGLWARGTDRMYVHRGSGHYGFPVRIGVPAEESVLSVCFAQHVQGGSETISTC